MSTHCITTAQFHIQTLPMHVFFTLWPINMMTTVIKANVGMNRVNNEEMTGKGKGLAA